MPNRNSTTRTYSVTSAEIPKGYRQRPTNYYLKKKELPLPHEEDPKILAERFNKFFTSKIEKIMAALVPTDTHLIDESYIETKPQTDHKFSEFNILSDQDVGRIVKKSATKSCILGPVPTNLLKEHHDDYIPTLADIINNSLQHGKFPDKLKNAAVQPLLKKGNL